MIEGINIIVMFYMNKTGMVFLDVGIRTNAIKLAMASTLECLRQLIFHHCRFVDSTYVVRTY